MQPRQELVPRKVVAYVHRAQYSFVARFDSFRSTCGSVLVHMHMAFKGVTLQRAGATLPLTIKKGVSFFHGWGKVRRGKRPDPNLLVSDAPPR